MLVSLLLSCLFFGLISMILPSGRKSEWIYVLLISVLILSVGSHLGMMDFSIPETEDVSSEASDLLPESVALQSAVSNHVFSLTGQMPILVESDLQRRENTYELTWIRVVIRSGNEQEVQDALQKDFSFQGFTVVRENTDGSHQDFHLFSEESLDDYS